MLKISKHILWEKLATIAPLYQIAKSLLLKLNLSQQNIYYYASLVDYYTIFDLREKLKPEQTYLYLVCYIWKRYQQLNDNLVNAFCYLFSHFEDEITEKTNEIALEILKKISPVAWRHIHFQGHFKFSEVNAIDLEAIIEKLILSNTRAKQAKL